jgi:hypothetical protein
MKTRTIRCCSHCEKIQSRPFKGVFLIKWVWMVCEKCR